MISRLILRMLVALVVALLPLGVVAVSWWLAYRAAFVVVPLVALTVGLLFLVNYGVAASSLIRGRLRASAAGFAQRRPAPGAAGEPALRQYFFGQAFADYRAILGESLRINEQVIRGDHIRGFALWLLTGKRDASPWPAFNRLFNDPVANRVLVASAVPFGLVFSVGVLASIAVAFFMYLALGIVHLGIVTAAAAVCVALAIVLRGLEAVRLLIRRIRITCPHPGCYQRVPLPIYECRNGSCRRRHRKLLPGVYGIFRRTCACGSSLPTLFILGRHEIVGFCPACDRPLPDRSGSARAVHVPVVGGPSAGKTMLMMSIVMTLERLSNQSLVTFSFATESDRREYQQAKALLSLGSDLRKTVVQLPRAFMVYVGSPGGPTRLLYLYDPAGEYYQSSDLLGQQLYLRHAAGLLFVLDPFSIPLFVAGLGSANQHVTAAARPSMEDPESAYHRLIGNLRAMTQGLAQKRLAVVVSKADALEQLRLPKPLPADGGEIRSWIHANGLGNLIRSMEHDLGEVSYFRLSARRAATAPSIEGAVTEPVLWLLEQSGLDLRPSVRLPVR
ncbi:MAG: TRAFAC clade GTPase domain-containing protein [Actinomycetota bacterium]